MSQLDPDRFLDFQGPGAQEWWYFDAISDDGRDAVVVVWYAGLPFDPDYGVATLRHLKNPTAHPAPTALDHCAIGFSWYHDGKTAAYALNGFRSGDFTHAPEPFVVAIAGNRLDRDGRDYCLTVATPAVDGKHRIAAELRFRPAPASESLEQDLGNPGSPHLWILAAADCRAEGRIRIAGPRPLDLEFLGRGYHDHNAGAEELSVAMTRWHWGRVHDGSSTEIYYRAEPRSGAPRNLWITCHDGRPVAVRNEVTIAESELRRNVFGVRDPGILTATAGRSVLIRRNLRCLDDGPFYRRSLAKFDSEGRTSVGISELLDTRNLHRRLFNWMIPYRLKRPGPGGHVAP